MEDLRPLITTCKHLRREARDETIERLCRQKHAAHARASRLRRKVNELELTNRLLSACWVSATKHIEAVNSRIAEISRQTQDLPQ